MGRESKSRGFSQTGWVIVLVASYLSLGCGDFLATMFARGLEFAIHGVQEIKESNVEARQARVSLKPRPNSERSRFENDVLSLANSKVRSGKPSIKEVFCGNPPDLEHLPEVYFAFESSVYFAQETQQGQEECRATSDDRFPDYASCYLVFDNGSTGYLSCFHAGEEAKKGITCLSTAEFLWELARDEDLRKACPGVSIGEGG